MQTAKGKIEILEPSVIVVVLFLASRVVVLGCGVGGLALSSSLANKVKDRAKITVIERKSTFDFPPSFPWVMMGARTAEQVQRSLNAFGKKGVELIQDDINQISLDNHQVRTVTGQLRI
jgi:sulfide:quinone oxidoreductase